MLQFSRKPLQNLVVEDFMLLLTPFESKLTEESIFEDLEKYRKLAVLLKKWSKWQFHRTFKRSVFIT